MDLKEKLVEVTRMTTGKGLDIGLVTVFGMFGLALVVLVAWLFFNDWQKLDLSSQASNESRQAVEGLIQSVRSLKTIMNDEQAQALAARAVDDKEALPDLTSHLSGLVSELQEVRVFPLDFSSMEPSELGPNGFAIYEMVLMTLETEKGLMQVHYALNPPLLHDSTVIKQDGKVTGVMILVLEPAYLLKDFNPGFGSLGAIQLTQYNGRQPLSQISQWGDVSQLGEVPERVPVPGTLFRIEFPMQQQVSQMGKQLLGMLLILGVFCLAASAWFYRRNKKRPKNKPVARPVPRVSAEPPPAAGDLVASVESSPSIKPDSGSPPDAKEPDSGDKDFSAEAPADDLANPPPMRLQYNIAERRKLREAEHTPIELLPEIFRAYDIRGVIDKTLDSGVAKNVGQVVGSLALEKNSGPVVVARDGRLSGPYLMEGMIEGILSTGCDVLDIGAVPTGVLYFAAHELASGSGVMITGSHNPPDYNGFKIMIAGDPLHGEAISAFYDRIKQRDVRIGEGNITRKDVVPDYIKKIADDVTVERQLKVVIDCGNGIGGVCAAETLRALGVEVLPLFDEVDGTFPNHHPDPSEPENLVDLIESVRLIDADLGLALDGDADRLGVVTLAGNIIYADRVMMLLALDVLDRKPGATIIYDVKCTNHLPKVIKEAGGNPVMYKTGHSLIKARMKEIGSPFAGEMSGHFFFGERWYGVDDGIYAAARLLEILGSTEAPPEAILNALPTSFSTPELKVQMQEGENHAFVEAFKASAQFEGAQINTIDGLRADFDDGWGLVRASNTTPILVVRFDGETEEALIRIKAVFRSRMLEVKPDLELNF